MIDVALAVVMAGLLVSIVVVLRSLGTAVILVAVGISISGVLLQFLAQHGASFTFPVLRWWLVATLAVILVAGVAVRRRNRSDWDRVTLSILGGTSAAIAVAFLVSRMLAPGSPGPLTGVGYLIERSSAEDNAKWLNAAAQLASGGSIDAWANVGGGLLLLLTLSATIISAFSTILYGGVNEVAVSSGTLILSEMLLIVIAPLAIAPLAEARLRLKRREEPYRIPWPYVLLSAVLLASAVTVLLNFGHLTLQFTILVLTVWVSTFLASRTTAHARLLTTVAVIALAETWFPLNVMAAGLLVALIVWAIRGLARGTQRNLRLTTLVGSLVLLVLMWEFLRSSITYALGIDGGAATAASIGGAIRGVAAIAVPSLPLFASPGGTEVVSALLGAMTVASVVIAFVTLGLHRKRGWAPMLPFAPIAVLAVYTLLITLADYWAVGKGPGYATNKLTFAITIPILVSAGPIALLAFDRSDRRMTPLRWLAVGGVVALLVLDTLLPRALTQFKPALWPTIAADPQPYWWPGEVRPTADQPLTSNPIGCIYLPPTADKPTVLPNGQRAYSCTRLLTGIAGQDVAAASVVEWTLDEWLQNESMWDKYHAYFTELPAETRARTLILLDEDSKVVGVQPIQQLLDRYPPAAEPAAP